MNSRMAILTEVEFRHGYFKDGLSRPLSFTPADSSLRKMMSHGLLLKAKPGGLMLLYDTTHAGSQRSRADVLTRGLSIRVLLRLEDSFFFNYTSPLPFDTGRQVLYFCNRPGRLFLHKKEQVSGSDLFELTAPCERPGRKIILEPSARRPFEIPFAILDLRLYPGRLEEHYAISFQARSTWWNYILVGDHLKELQDPAILFTGSKHTDPVRKADPAKQTDQANRLFKGPISVPLRDDRTGLSFMSPDLMEASETPGSTCTLVENYDPVTERYKVVIATLPVPDTRIISRGNIHDNTADRSEIFLY